MKEIYFVGQDIGAGRNEFQGVFDSFEKAIAACRTKDYFWVKAELNKDYSHETNDLDGDWYDYPLRSE